MPKYKLKRRDGQSISIPEHHEDQQSLASPRLQYLDDEYMKKERGLVTHVGTPWTDVRTIPQSHNLHGVPNIVRGFEHKDSDNKATVAAKFLTTLAAGSFAKKPYLAMEGVRSILRNPNLWGGVPQFKSNFRDFSGDEYRGMRERQARVREWDEVLD